MRNDPIPRSTVQTVTIYCETIHALLPSPVEKVHRNKRGKSTGETDIKDNDFVRQFRTAAVGTGYGNPDGSDRQAALKKLKADEKIRLIWDVGSPSNRQIVYLVRSGRTRKLSMADCFGRLNDKVAADVVQWLNRDNITTSARVVKIVGGTRKRPELGCVLELTAYS